MLSQWIKASAASFFLIVGTLAMFNPAAANDGVVAAAADGKTLIS